MDKRGLRERGFSMIELMVGLAVFGVLLAVGLPSLQAYSMNNRLLTTAQSFVSGIQTARTEAIRRNTPVQFLMTDSTVVTDPNNATPSSTGKNWIVFVPNPTGVPEVVDSKAAEGAAATVAVSMVDAASSAVSSITFNSFGGSSLGSVATLSVTPVDASTCNSASSHSDIRCVNVVVTPGGRSQLCDPAATATTDSRRCIYS
jgi:type IV fimbrial biogenesis protein FimT